jgi:D-alanyl-D-alanine dipeptidase
VDSGDAPDVPASVVTRVAPERPDAALAGRDPDLGAAADDWASAVPVGLVDVRAAVPGACFDIRYATADNFTGAPLAGYETPGAWLRPEAAGALARADAALREAGYAVLVFDAYRPARASRAMVSWARAHGRGDLLRDGYIAARSTHAQGRTVDVGLCDASTGVAIELGTDFDAFVPESHVGGVQGPPAVARRRLREAMRAAGFSPYAREWWHFSYPVPEGGAGPHPDVPYGGGDVATSP